MKDHRELPIYLKAREILKITQAIIETIDEELDDRDFRNVMFDKAAILGAKIAGAESAGIFHIKMEMATLVKIAGEELWAQTALCQSKGLSEPHYLQVLRDDIEEFKGLFRDWVSGFDPSLGIDDGWGLYDRIK